MLRNRIGTLVVVVLGYFCGIGADGNNGAIQLVSIMALSVIVAIAITLVWSRHFHIVTLYSIAFTVGIVAYVFVNRVRG